MAIEGKSAGTQVSEAGATPIGQQARKAAADVVSQAQETLASVAGQAKEHVASQIQGRKHGLADGLGSLADALRGAGAGLRKSNQAGTPQAVEFAADHVEGVAEYLRERDLGDLVVDAEYAARRNPALFIGGAFLLGVFVARFVKSSKRAVEKSAPKKGASAAGSSTEPSRPRPVMGTSGR